MTQRAASREIPFRPIAASLMLLFLFLVLGGGIYGFTTETGIGIAAGVAAIVCLGFTAPGFFVVDPNRARVLVLFGTYRGTVRQPGFYWTSPFTIKTRVSLRDHNLHCERLKVNDLLGNPVEIAMIVVWRVRDTAQAMFDVENFAQFVSVQCESALRTVASSHPYDDGQHEHSKTTLRGSAEQVIQELVQELRQRLEPAGIEVMEARLSHLAYAPEIAAAMLQRQQAGAVIAARQMIVDGAVGMVEMALRKLSDHQVVELDAERRATLVGNLLVVLCGHATPTPVLNTGSLYT
jgi:regulator of protease activity HflC (stomatin/prohibitin superfamily)